MTTVSKSTITLVAAARQVSFRPAASTAWTISETGWGEFCFGDHCWDPERSTVSGRPWVYELAGSAVGSGTHRTCQDTSERGRGRRLRS